MKHRSIDEVLVIINILSIYVRINITEQKETGCKALADTNSE